MRHVIAGLERVLGKGPKSLGYRCNKNLLCASSRSHPPFYREPQSSASFCALPLPRKKPPLCGMKELPTRWCKYKTCGGLFRFRSLRECLFALLLLFLLIFCSGPLRADDDIPKTKARAIKTLLIVSQLPMKAEKAVRQGIAKELGPKTAIKILRVNGNDKTFYVRLDKQLNSRPKPEAIISLGSKPSRLLSSQPSKVPRVYLGVRQMLARQLSEKKLEKMRGVDFELCQKSIFQRLAQLLPKARMIGTIKEVASGSNENTEPATHKLQGNLLLKRFCVKRRRDIARTAIRLLKECDVLWLRPSKLLNQPDTVRYLLGKALEMGRPVIGLSQNYVRAGALFCLQPDFRDIGSQLASILRDERFGRDGYDDGDLDLEPPRRSILCVNAKVAQLLGLRLSPKILNDKNVVVVRR